MSPANTLGLIALKHGARYSFEIAPLDYPAMRSMSQSLLQEIKAVVDKRIDPLLNRRKELQAELETIEAEIGIAQQAISALEGKPAASAPQARVKATRKRNKSSASVEKVLEVMTAELKRGGGKLSKADLLGATKDKLKDAGFGLTGLKQRAEKLMAEEDRFVLKGNSVSMSAKAG